MANPLDGLSLLNLSFLGPAPLPTSPLSVLVCLLAVPKESLQGGALSETVMWLAAKPRSGHREDIWPWGISVFLIGSVTFILPLARPYGPELHGIN